MAKTPAPPAQPAKQKNIVQRIIQGVAGAWMGPLQPLPPMAPQAAGRMRDYPVGQNMVIRTREPGQISARELRNFVLNCDVVSALIETRKDQISALSWTIMPKDKDKVKGNGDADDAPIVKEIKKFLKKPDKRNSWGSWIRPLLDDMFIIDAMTIYKRRDISGQIYSLDFMDGSLIKVLVDEDGRVPMYPNPSYQQLLKGMPAVDYTTQDLIYAPRSLRTWSVYGYSPVEQIIITIQTMINRARFNVNYYLEGNTPESILFMPPEMTVQELDGFQNFLDAALTGDLAARRRMKLMPGGTGSKLQEIKQPVMADAMDDYLIRIACYAFSIPPTAFVKQMNRATSDTAKDAAAEEGLAPITKWLKEMMDDIIEEEFQTEDYEFIWTETKEQDQAQAATIRQGDVKNGIITINEARELIGLEPIEGAADEIGVITATGFVPIEMAVQQLQENHDASIEAIKNPPPPAGAAPPKDGKKPPEKNKKVEKTDGSKKNSMMQAEAVAAKATSAAARKISVVLAKTAHSVAHQISNSKILAKVDDLPESIVGTLDLSGLDGIKHIQDEQKFVFAQTFNAVLDEFEVPVDSGLFNQVSTRAVEFSDQRAAEMVSQITDSTRDMLRTAITNGLKNKLTKDQIANEIMGVDSSVFGKDRSEFIASTEIRIANGNANLAGLQAVKDSGANILKQWDTKDLEACPICIANEDEGPIPLDQEFSSGDQTNPAHPRCFCSVSGVVDEK